MSILAIQKLRAFSKTLPAGHRAAVNYALQHDPYLRKFADLLNRLPNQPLNLATDRRAHVLKVIANFHTFLSGKFEALHALLYDQEKAKAPLEQYKAELKEARNLYAKLTPAEKSEIHLAIVLHDIGYLHVSGHEHEKVGGEMVPELVTRAHLPVDGRKVGMIVGNHALTNNFGNIFFPEDLLVFPERVRQQIYILDCLDITAKGSDLKSKLGLRLLKEMGEILSGSENLSNQAWFYEYRLRHLWGPNTYVWLSDLQLTQLKTILEKELTPAERAAVEEMTLYHLVNGAFPVFQELFLAHEGRRETVILLKEIALRITELNLPPKERVYFATEPNIFSMPLGGPERNRAIGNLKKVLSLGTFDRKQNLLVSHHAKDDSKIILQLEHLGKIVLASMKCNFKTPKCV